MIGGTAISYAQSSVDAQMKEVRKRHKTDKMAKNEAKKREKSGWTVFEGSLPMVEQMEENFTRQHMMDEDGEPLYYFGHGSFRTDDKNAAFKNACLAARQDIASQLETELVEAFSTDVRSEKVSPDESVSVSKAFAEGKAIVNSKLAGVRPVVRLYRRDKYQYEVEVDMYYSREKARQIAQDAVRERLAHEDTSLKNLVDDVLNAKLKK
ncbi:MAG: hypothetical protein HDR48_00420 [Bacteroides sp.]|nr:hypothetical protein [Bacteroides sp.]